jgi:hypothetical protein
LDHVDQDTAKKLQAKQVQRVTERNDHAANATLIATEED